MFDILASHSGSACGEKRGVMSQTTSGPVGPPLCVVCGGLAIPGGFLCVECVKAPEVDAIADIDAGKIGDEAMANEAHHSPSGPPMPLPPLPTRVRPAPKDNVAQCDTCGGRYFPSVFAACPNCAVNPPHAESLAARATPTNDGSQPTFPTSMRDLYQRYVAELVIVNLKSADLYCVARVEAVTEDIITFGAHKSGATEDRPVLHHWSMRYVLGCVDEPRFLASGGRQRLFSRGQSRGIWIRATIVLMHNTAVHTKGGGGAFVGVSVPLDFG